MSLVSRRSLLGLGTRPRPAPSFSLAALYASRGVSSAASRGPRRVEVVQSACLAHGSGFCSVCKERCPVEGAVVVDRGRPTIDADRCTGCGECIAGCPAPTLALRFVGGGP